MPRRVVGRSRLTEGEACELEERHFDRDIAVADGVVVDLAVGSRPGCTMAAGPMPPSKPKVENWKSA